MGGVERSVTIACVTTKQLVLKDYALEANETHLRSAAHMMISSLAGSLSLVTCKEPLRISIGNHLRTLMTSMTADQTAIEQVVQVCSSDNLDLGCMLIEKFATEKAIRDVDEALASSIQARRKHRETGQPFVDGAVPKGSRYPRELPEMLKPKAGGLHPGQLQVYEIFRRQRLQQQQAVQAAAAQAAHAPSTSNASDGSQSSISSSTPSAPLGTEPST